MGGNNRKDLKAYVRYDGSGRVVAGSLILRRQKPKVGKWVEIPAYECCNGTPSSFAYNTVFDSSAMACYGSGTAQVLYSASSTLELGSTMYYDSALTIPYGGAEGDGFSYEGNYYQLDIMGIPANAISNISNCF